MLSDTGGPRLAVVTRRLSLGGSILRFASDERAAGDASQHETTVKDKHGVSPDSHGASAGCEQHGGQTSIAAMPRVGDAKKPRARARAAMVRFIPEKPTSDRLQVNGLDLPKIHGCCVDQMHRRPEQYLDAVRDPESSPRTRPKFPTDHTPDKWAIETGRSIERGGPHPDTVRRRPRSARSDSSPRRGRSLRECEPLSAPVPGP